MSWLAFHAHYHGNRDLLLTDWVRPVVEVLLAARRIRRFFFIRFDLGGPHVRLRLEIPDGHDATVEEAVEEAVERAANELFRRAPSTEPLAEEVIRRQSVGIVKLDPGEDDDTVYPDNSLHRAPFQPETERYGGPRLLEPSLDFFTLSSVRVLGFVAEHGDLPRGRQLSQALRLLFRQAVGLASGGEDLAALLEGLVTSRGDALAPIAERGDQIFEQQREVLSALLRQEIETLAEAGAPATFGTPCADAGAARALADAVAGADPPTRHRIAWSQIHMTANRLGLTNPEEVYLSRLLARALAVATAADPRTQEHLQAALARPAPAPLAGCLAEALASLGGDPGSALSCG